MVTRCLASAHVDLFLLISGHTITHLYTITVIYGVEENELWPNDPSSGQADAQMDVQHLTWQFPSDRKQNKQS